MVKKTNGTSSPMNMLQKLLPIATVLLLAAVLIAPVAAAEGDVAKVGDKTYTDLQEAINVAGENSGTVMLLNNVGLTTEKPTETGKEHIGLQIASGKKLTLDLNGSTISFNSDYAGTTCAIDNKGDLTIMDSSDDKSGEITFYSSNPDTATSPTYATNTIRNGGYLTIQSGTINNTCTNGASYAIDTAWYSDSSDFGPTLTINGGKVVAVKPAIRLLGYAEIVSNSLTITAGEIIGTRAVYIQLPDNDNTKSPLVDVNINGGTLTRTNTADLAIYSYSFGNSFEKVSINILGGTFNGDIGVSGGTKTGAETVSIAHATINGDVYSYNSNKKSITINCGTFSLDPESNDYGGYPVEWANYLPEGYVYSQSEDGSWTAGKAIAEFTEIKTVSYSGTIQSYDIASTLDGFVISYSQNGQAVSEPINAGTYDVTITRAASHNPNGDCYAAFKQELASGLVIEKATLTATYVSETIAEGETPKGYVEVTGFITGESAANAKGYVAPTVTTTETAVGVYTLTPSGGEADNYEFTPVAGTLAIQAEEDKGKLDPEVPASAGEAKAGETTTITVDTGSSITINQADSTATIQDKNGAVTLTVEFASIDSGSTSTAVSGTFKSAEAVYSKAEAETPDDVGEISHQLTLTLSTLTTSLPEVDATIKTDQKNEIKKQQPKLNPAAMLTVDSSINTYISGKTFTITFYVNKTWADTNSDKLWSFHLKGTDLDLEKINLAGLPVVADSTGASYQIPVTGTSFSTYGIVAGEYTEKQTQSSSSSSYGSSVWLTEPVTPTEQPTQTPTEGKPTDVAPADIPSTQPTATPETPGFGVLSVLAGLGAVAVLRRK